MKPPDTRTYSGNANPRLNPTSDARKNSYFPVVVNGQAAQDAIATLNKLSQGLGAKIRMDGDIGIIEPGAISND